MERIRLSMTEVMDFPLSDKGQILVRFYKHPYLLMKVGKNRKSFYVDFWHRNQHYQRKLGVFPAMTVDEFLREGEKIYREVLGGGVLPTTLTLSAFFIGTYGPIIKVKNLSYRDDVERFKNHVHPVLGSIPMAEIRSIQLEKLFNKLALSMAPATVNHVRALLHRMFEVAIRHDYVNTNPVKKTDRFKVDNVVNRTMTPLETERFIEECLKETNNPSVMALLYALLTSPRIGNICELKWSQVSFTEKTMLLEHTKSGKKLLVPLSDEAITILQLRLEFRTGEYVFSKDPAGLIPISYPRSVFTRICKQAGISTTGALHAGREGFPAAPLTIHCLRKTNSSRLLQTHNDIYLCKELLGHSDVKVTERYSFYLPQQFKDAVQGLFQLSAHTFRKLI